MVVNNFHLVEPVDLKQLRMLYGLSQSGFANKLEVPITTYRRWELNPKKMKIEDVLNVCQKCEIQFMDLKF